MCCALVPRSTLLSQPPTSPPHCRYLDDHLTYGMSPDDVPSTFVQRLRWAMGAIQIFIRNNPLVIPGLTHAQSLLFYDSCASHFLAIGIVFVSFVPIVYMFSGMMTMVVVGFWVWGCVAEVLRVWYLGVFLVESMTFMILLFLMHMHLTPYASHMHTSHTSHTLHTYRCLPYSSSRGSSMGVCGSIPCILLVQSYHAVVGVSRLLHGLTCTVAHLPTSGT